jgi:hypothetical protein
MEVMGVMARRIAEFVRSNEGWWRFVDTIA